MQIETGEPGDEPDFDSVFAREDVKDSHDSEADAVASEASHPRDEQGRFTSVHDTRVDDVAATVTEPAKAVAARPEQQPASQTETTDTAQARMIPLPELLSERQKRQDSERRIAELQGQLQAFQQMVQQQRPQSSPQPHEQPDWLASPEQAAQAMQAQFESRLWQTKLDLSELAIKDKHSDYEQVAAVFAEQARNDPDLLRRLYEHSAPAQFAYQIGKRIQHMQKVGNDVDGYEKRVREEERQKVLAELKAGGVNADQPQPVFPGSLASATRTGRQGGHIDPQTAADSVFAR